MPAVATGARGIVSAATGAGYPTPAEVEALERASGIRRDRGPGDACRRRPRAGVASLRRARTGSPPTTSVPGRRRILLRLALASGITDRDDLQVFDEG